MPMLLSLAAPLTAPRPARMAPRRAATVQPRASQPRASQRAGAAAAEVSSQPRHSLSAGGGARAAPGADAPEQQRALSWYEVPGPANMLRVDTMDELQAVLRKANADGRARLVCVEFIASHCAGCRTLYPKLCRMASDEFPTVQFVKVLGDEAAALAQACGVDRFPLFQFFVGSHGKVAEFSANLSADGLAKLRRALRYHSTPRSSIVSGQRGPASLIEADGWPNAPLM